MPATKIYKIIFITLSISMLNACIKHQSGYVFNNRKISQIKVGKSTKFDIISTLGTPTFASVPDNKNLYYAEQKSYRFLFIRDIPYERRILEFTFDKQDLLVKMTTYNLEDAKRGCSN